MELLLARDASTAVATPGSLHVNGFFECFTLEDIVREVPGQPVAQWKVPGKTAIPFGKYKVVIDFSNRFQRDMPHVLNVPGFDGVRIHSGNTSADTEGCILLGKVRQGPDFIAHSRDAFNAFFPKLQLALLAKEEVTLSIVRSPEAT